MSETKTIFKVNEKYAWLREPLLMRLPDDSLFCAIFLGGEYDGCRENFVAGIRSDDDGETWSPLEIIKAIKSVGCWACSVFEHNGTGYIFWMTLNDDRRDMTGHLLSTGEDGRSFEHDRLMPKFSGAHCGTVDTRRGTKLRNGRVLLPIAWQEVVGEPVELTAEQAKRLSNLGGATNANKVFCCGILEPNEDFTDFTRHGRVCQPTPTDVMPSIPLFENQIAELSDDSLAMLMRADLTNRLWRSDSADGGHSWSDPVKTEIPNPGSKPLIINLPDGRIVLFHNPSEKNYDDIDAFHHAYRTPLEMWISNDDMNTWPVKETLMAAPAVAMYPDGFYDKKTGLIYLVWENDEEVFFKKISV